MKKKTTAPRVRTQNLYTVELDGQPVAQALVISQAEAVRLYEESQKKPLLTARLSSPLEARTLAGLPLLTRGDPVRDEATPDLFEGAASAPVADPVLLATYCPPVDLPVKTYPPAVLEQMVAELVPDHLGDAAEMVPPQHAPIETEGISACACDCAEPAGTPADAPPESVDAPTLGERMAGACSLGNPEWAAQVAADVARYRAAHIGGKVVAKYRNPDDGSTWTGRGLKPRWLVAAQESGKTLADFLI